MWTITSGRSSTHLDGSLTFPSVVYYLGVQKHPSQSELQELSRVETKAAEKTFPCIHRQLWNNLETILVELTVQWSEKGCTWWNRCALLPQNSAHRRRKGFARHETEPRYGNNAYERKFWSLRCVVEFSWQYQFFNVHDNECNFVDWK